MSNYHIKSISKNGRNASVVFHIPIPVENNAAGVGLRTAISQYILRPLQFGQVGSDAFVSRVPWILQPELDQLKAGGLFELPETVSFLAADSNAQKQNKIDNRYSLLTTNALNEIRAILKFWGKDRDVP